MLVSFGKTLQRIRRKKCKTQRQIANKMKMDYSYFSRLENDRFDSQPTRETVEKIGEALECTDEELGELLAAAGRVDRDLEKATRIASEKPMVGKLFRSVVHLPADRVEAILEQVESELKAKRKSKKESG
jgi:transcriptional regulator with XRE-family HTH domain